MAHEIMEKDTAVFNRVAAWHRLGTVVDSDMSPNDALSAAGLDWNVYKSSFIKASIPDCDDVFSTDYAALIREDTKEILSVQSADYQVIQNKEHFEMAYELSNDVKVESALSLKNGRKVVLLLRGDTFDVAGFASLLQRIRAEKSVDIYYPVFDRSIEESIAAQGVVTQATKIVIVEGNYLLHDTGGWEAIADLLDA